MFTRLKPYAYAPIAALALWAVLLAVLPATANAKQTSQAKDPQITNRDAGTAERVVVAPGDSLWSISAQWLGPEATTRQIADGVERIYTLNQRQIGSNPNLIFAGQRLLLPSEVERQVPERGRATPARHAGEPMASSPPLRVANNGLVTRAGAAVGEADKARQVPDGWSEPASLPEPARVVPISAVRPLTSTDSSPSLEKSVTSGGARSIVSVGVAAVGEAFLRESYSGRKLLGGALVAMSTILAIILAVHVARVVWGPSYARRRARKRWAREALGTNYTSFDTFHTRAAYAAASVAFEGHPSDGTAQKAENPTPAAKASSSEDVRKIARSRQVRIRQMRLLKAKRPPRGHAKAAAGGPRLGQARRRPVNRIHRVRALRGKGDRIVSTEPREPDPTQEWEIGEPLKRSIGAIPLPPRVPARNALAELKTQGADALRTMALLERRRRLTDKEHRQARALQRLLVALKEAYCENTAR